MDDRDIRALTGVRAGRYARQVILPGVGESGQARIGAAHAAVVGCGAIGSASAEALARAGVGRLTIIDRDVVEWSNLPRQGLFDERDAAEGLPKAEAAARRLRAVNSEIEVRAVVADVRAGNVERLVGDAAVVVDGTDNFEARYLLNDVAVKHGLAYVYGGVIGTRGMAAAFVPGGACLRCVFDEPPEVGSQPTCETAGVLGAAAAMVGAMQAAGALESLLNVEGVGLNAEEGGGGAGVAGERAGSGVAKRREAARARGSVVLREFDVWGGVWREVRLSRRAGCECCGRREFRFLEAGEGDAVTLCGREAVQVWPRMGAEVDLAALAGRLAGVGGVARVQRTAWMVRAEVEPGVEVTVFGDGRAIVKGTREESRARAVYARWVGG